VLIAKNIKHQIQQAINNNFNEGIDKHASKHQDQQEEHTQVYSYDEKFRLLDTAKMLQNYIKDTGLNIKEIKNITPELIQQFLNNKSSKCTQNTINTYAQSLNKIAAICNKNYSSCNLTWKKDIVIPTAITSKSNLRGVNNQMPLSDLNKICEYAKQNYSVSGQAVLAQRELGIRINELTTIKVENIDLKNNVVHLINCKGGKNLDREITPELRKIFEENIKMRNITKGRLFPTSENTVNTYLRRTEEKLDIQGRYSIHNIRSSIAQEYYDRLRNSGVSKSDSIKQTSIWLNHGPDRENLLKTSYIDIW